MNYCGKEGGCMVCDELFCPGREEDRIHTVFISLPMNGRTNDEILQDIYWAKTWYLQNGRRNKNTVFVTNFGAEFSQRPEMKKELEAVWFLGSAIQKMAQCDEVLFWGQWGKARGCRIEHEVALTYNIPVVYGTDWQEEPDLVPEKAEEIRDNKKDPRVEKYETDQKAWNEFWGNRYTEIVQSVNAFRNFHRWVSDLLEGDDLK